ncbi:MAG: hypothetical protein WC381_10695 [Kiritimatiellia bacterium]|jgi:hypothetical protein
MNKVMNKSEELSRQLACAVNRCGIDNDLQTPDYAIADYLIGCLAAFEVLAQRREASKHYFDVELPKELQARRPACACCGTRTENTYWHEEPQALVCDTCWKFWEQMLPAKERK